MLRRRDAVLAGAAGLLGAAGPNAAGAVPGRLMGPDAPSGHRLREGGLPEPSSTRRVRVVVVGGGVAGLSAAWRLNRLGIDDVLLVELEKEVGGNARGGRNAVSAYPWGAHYVPLLTAEAVHAQALVRGVGDHHRAGYGGSAQCTTSMRCVQTLGSGCSGMGFGRRICCQRG